MSTIQKLFFFFLFFCASLIQAGVNRVILDKKAYSFTWLHLLKYESRLILGGYKSEADAKKFFVHPNGKTDPRSELKQILTEIQNKNLTVICRFPARVKWVQKEGLVPVASHFSDWNSCEEFSSFRKTFNVKKFELVFSSYYINNPSSAFGHTFLSGVVDLNVSRKHLNFAVNYAASTNTNNAFLYGLYGITGFFPGKFSSLPFYFQIRKYNDFENRDLWFYRLKMTQQQVEFLIEHIYEMKDNHFDYYYLTENCSYHILRLLEPALGINITKSLNTPVLPVDTIKVLIDNDLLESIDWMPSQNTKYKDMFSLLSAKQKKIVLKLLQRKKVDNSLLSEYLDNRVIETTIAGFRKENAYDLKHKQLKKETKLWYQALLSKRAQIAQTNIKKFDAVKMKEDPALAHPTSRIGVGASFDSQTVNSYFVEWRSVLHDFLDSPKGMSPFTSIEFFEVRLSYIEKINKVKLTKFTLIDIQSFEPWSMGFKPWSWRLQLGGYNLNIKRCRSCFAWGGRLQGGISSKEFLKGSFTFLLGINPYWHERKDPIGALLLGHLIYRNYLTDNFLILWESELNYDILFEKNVNWHSQLGIASHFHPNFQIRFLTKYDDRSQWSWSTALYAYY